MFELKKRKSNVKYSVCKFCGKETEDELSINYKDNGGTIFRICESCQLNLLTVLHRGIDG